MIVPKHSRWILLSNRSSCRRLVGTYDAEVKCEATKTILIPSKCSIQSHSVHRV